MGVSRLHLLLGALLFYATGTSVFAKSALKGMSQAMDLRRKQMERFQALMAPAHTQAEPLNKRDELITFSNPKAKEFYVDGTKIPDGTLGYGLSSDFPP